MTDQALENRYRKYPTVTEGFEHRTGKLDGDLPVNESAEVIAAIAAEEE